MGGDRAGENYKILIWTVLVCVWSVDDASRYTRELCSNSKYPPCLCFVMHIGFQEIHKQTLTGPGKVSARQSSSVCFFGAFFFFWGGVLLCCGKHQDLLNMHNSLIPGFPRVLSELRSSGRQVRHPQIFQSFLFLILGRFHICEECKKCAGSCCLLFVGVTFYVCLPLLFSAVLLKIFAFDEED